MTAVVPFPRPAANAVRRAARAAGCPGYAYVDLPSARGGSSRAEGMTPEPPREGLAWSAREDALLRTVLTSGLAFAGLCAELAKIAEYLGRTVGEVAGRCDYLVGPAAVAEGKATATERALLALFGRAAEDPRGAGGFRLDGRPADARAVIAAANAELARAGKPPIAWPGLGAAALRAPSGDQS